MQSVISRMRQRQVAELLDAGAVGFVGRQEGAEAVFRAMRTVHAGNVAFGPGVATAVVRGGDPHATTSNTRTRFTPPA